MKPYSRNNRSLYIILFGVLIVVSGCFQPADSLVLEDGTIVTFTPSPTDAPPTLNPLLAQATALVQQANDIAQTVTAQVGQPIITSAQTEIPATTPGPTTTFTATVTQTQTLTPSITQLPTQLAPSASVSLKIFLDANSLILYVSQQVSLDGLQFADIASGTKEVRSLQDAFPILQLTDDIAQPDTCFVYQFSGSSSPLPESCDGQVFIYAVAPSDRFWFDGVGGRLRDIAILHDGTATGAVCPAAQAECEFKWSNQ